ncbi:MAG: prepilin-type N-terminal cleavage/methylation domain-containing protein [Patescibacteria group bacterium]
MRRARKNFGFTIIETMIAISLFLVVVMAGMDALLNANVVHQKSQDMRSILDSLNFIMEDMGRNIRTGYNYHCYTGGASIPVNPGDPDVQPLSCASGWGILFEPATGDSTTADGDPIDYTDQWVYYFGPDTGLPGSPYSIWKKTSAPYSSASFVKLNTDEVVLNSASSGLSVLGAERPTTNTQQPLVSIRLSGTITFKNQITPFSLQTTVSQRVIDVLP